MPKKANIRYSEESIHDLSAIFEYIAEGSETRALEYIERLETAISALSDNPNLGVTCKRKLVRRDCCGVMFKMRLSKKKVTNLLSPYKYEILAS